MRKSMMKAVMMAGVMALVPAMGHAYSGILINCNPTDGLPIPVSFSPGLDCTERLEKIAVSTTIDGCTEDATAPWDNWAAVKFPTKMTAALANSLTSTSLSLKAKVLGTCEFGASANAFTGSGAGKFAFVDGAGNKYGKGSVFGTVNGDLATTAAAVRGLVTKGDLVGATVSASIGIDIPNNGPIVNCNIGGCPAGAPSEPITTLTGITASNSYLIFGVPQNSDCTAASNPYSCCTGAGTGNC